MVSLELCAIAGVAMAARSTRSESIGTIIFNPFIIFTSIYLFIQTFLMWG